MDNEKVMIGIKLERGAVLPQKAHGNDAGFDLYCKGGFEVLPYSYKNHDTGVHMVIPEGYCGLIVTKSGLLTKNGLTTTGLIDSGYTGTITVSIHNTFDKEKYFAKGDKIAQIIILPVPQVELYTLKNLPPTERGNNGFGSTGK